MEDRGEAEVAELDGITLDDAELDEMTRSDDVDNEALAAVVWAGLGERLVETLEDGTGDAEDTEDEAIARQSACIQNRG